MSGEGAGGTGVGGGELERTLGFLEAMTLGGGTMIGAGIFILPGIAAQNAGPASAVSYALAGFVALLAALSLSELATGMPIAGGSYHYVNRALGGFFGAIVGWGMWTGLLFASAFYMVGFGQYIVAPVPWLDGRAAVVGLGLAGLGLLVAVNYYGTEESSALQNVMIGAETAVILVFVAAGVFFIVPANLSPFAPTGAPGVLATTGIVFISFLGFEIIATVAGEIKEPSRTIPRSMILSVVLVTVLYVLVMLVSTGIVTIEALAASPIPVSDVAAVSLGTPGVVAIVVAAVIAAISSSNSSILAASRVVYAMGRDGLMTGWFNESHPRFYTPHRAILATGAVTGGLVAAGLRVDSIIALLAEAASFTFLVTYALVHVAVVVFHRADPDEYDPSFRLSGALYPAVPVLGVVSTVVVISQMATVVVLIGSGIVALGVGWYFVYARGRVVEEGLLREALRRAPADRYRVLVPVSNPATQAGLLRLAAATASEHADGATPELVAVNVSPGPGEDRLRNVEADRVDHQHALLEATAEHAAGMAVDVRTRAVVAPDVVAALLDVVEEERPDQLLLGWDGSVDDEGPVFGATLDPVVAASPAPVSLVDLRAEAVGEVVALVAPGANAAAVARRAAELAAASGTVPSLLYAGSPGEEPAARTAERARAAVERIGEEAGLDPAEYAVEVPVDDDVAGAILEAVSRFDTVCVGLGRDLEGGRLPVGSVTARVAREARGNVVLVRGR